MQQLNSYPIENVSAQIRRLHNEIEGHLKKSLEKAVLIGSLLTNQKKEIHHGAFGKWIEANLPFTARTARNYMRLYRERDRLKTETVSDLKSAYRLLADPRPKYDIVDFILFRLFSDSSYTDEEIIEHKFHVVCYWVGCKLENDTSVIDLWMERAKKELGNKANITNEWHGPTITCWCPKCDGKTIDIRHWYEPKAA